MTTSPSFNKLPECDRCQFYAASPFLACTVHPMGVECDRCPDFREDNTRRWEQFLELDWVAGENEPGGQCEPEGVSYYNGELIINPHQRWNDTQRLELLDLHPLFTGRCPECEMPREQTDPSKVHWDCSECGWKDDSV